MHKYIFILGLIGTTVIGIKAFGAKNSEPAAKFCGLIIWTLSTTLLILVALGDIEP